MTRSSRSDVALFVLVARVGGAAGFTYWFNQATYYVSTNGSKVAIYEGRPGGFLWFHPDLSILPPRVVDGPPHEPPAVAFGHAGVVL